MAERLFTEIGVVKELSGARAKIKILSEEQDEERCHSCGMCAAGGEGRVLEVPRAEVKVGDRVQVEVCPPPILRGVFFLLLIPLLAFVAGAVLGEFAAPAVFESARESTTVISIVAAFALMGAAYLAVWLLGNRITCGERPEPRILRILDPRVPTTGAESESKTLFRAAALSEEVELRVKAEFSKIDGIEQVEIDRQAGEISVAYDQCRIGRGNLRELLLVMGVKVEN